MGRHYDDQRNVVVAEDGGVCQACGSKDHIKVHHIIPRSSGGRDVAGNLLTLCRSCEKAVHVDYLWSGFMRRNHRELPPETVFNVMLLREMRMLGRGSAKADTVRANYFRRRARPKGRLNPYDLSPASLNVAYVLEGKEIDSEQGPMLLRCGEFEVSVRRREEIQAV